MAKLHQQDLLLHLRRMLDGVRTGDTLEGSIVFTLHDEDHWNVTAAYRVGNLQGQGSMVLLVDKCTDYRPDHNGECLNCDEPASEHE